MKEVTFPLIVLLLFYSVLVYQFGLRASFRPPFLRMVDCKPIVAFLVRAVTRGRLRKSETVRDWFVFREGNNPSSRDHIRSQWLLVAGFTSIIVGNWVLAFTN